MLGFEGAYAGSMILFRKYLITSGFIWIIWVIVATLTFAYIRELFFERKVLHENIMILIYPFIIGILSWIATGNAIIMAAPIAAALVIPHILKMSIRRAIQTGRAIRKFMRARAKEIADEEFLKSYDRTEAILASKEFTFAEQKLHLLRELYSQAGFGLRNMLWSINGILKIIKKQLTILSREYKIEKKEEKKNERE